MGLTDKHLAYGDDIPQTQIEKDYYWKLKHLIEALEQKEKTGHWIERENCYECSECGVIRAKGKTGKYNFCPNCGANMR